MFFIPLENRKLEKQVSLVLSERRIKRERWPSYCVWVTGKCHKNVKLNYFTCKTSFRGYWKRQVTWNGLVHFREVTLIVEFLVSKARIKFWHKVGQQNYKKVGQQNYKKRPFAKLIENDSLPDSYVWKLPMLTSMVVAPWSQLYFQTSWWTSHAWLLSPFPGRIWP